MSYSISSSGDSALTVDFGNSLLQETSNKVLSLAQSLQEVHVPAIKDVVPAYSSVTIYYDAVALLKQHANESACTVMTRLLERLLAHRGKKIAHAFRSLRVPVCYELIYGPDLLEISSLTGLRTGEIIELHTGRKYKVYMIGFLPGFAYMGEVDERIAALRKPEPRQKIAAGSIGIAGKQTGIYPLASPGGWQIIGRTPVKLFNKESDDPVFFRAGDEVEFYAITQDEFDNY